MEQDFFNDDAPVAQPAQQNNDGQQHQDDAYDFSNNQNAQNAQQEDDFDFGQMNGGQQTQQQANISGSYGDLGSGYGAYNAVDDQATRKIQQEEQRIQQMLRQKANQEYEEKQRRKQEGRKQLEAFLDQKQAEKTQRKAQNIEKQQRSKQDMAKLNETAGWKKVAANVPLKQGEHPGSKDTTRMRQSIINKKNDQSQ